MDYGCYAPAVVFVDVFRRQGVPISMEEARAPMGAHKKVHIRKITQILEVVERWRQAHGRPPEESDVQIMFEDFVPRQLACLADYADLIPGTLEAVAEIRDRRLKIGSTTGYLRSMSALLVNEARERGYEPDAMVCAEDVPEGRPAPWMCVQNAMLLGVYPLTSIVKVGDTVPDIQEGLNAGMWTIGLAQTGNEVGLNAGEIAALSTSERKTKITHAYERLSAAGAHYVVDGIWNVPDILDIIAARVQRGERP